MLNFNKKSTSENSFEIAFLTVFDETASENLHDIYKLKVFLKKKFLLILNFNKKLFNFFDGRPNENLLEN